MKRLLALLLILVGFAASPTVVHAYPPGSATVTVTDPNPPPGGQFTVTVNHCVAGETVRIGFNPSQDVLCVEAFPGAGYGSASATFSAPLAAGPVNGTAILLGSNITLPWTVVVQSTSATVPATGATGVRENVTIAAGLVVVGGALLLVARSRRRPVAAA